MKNLVLGSEGFVGTPLCNYLRNKGEDVTGYDIKLGSEYDLRKCSLDLDSFDRVYFLAWEVGGAKYLYREDTQRLQMEWNIALMENVFMQLSGSNIPFVFVSSQLAQDCDTVYSITKRLGEFWARLAGGTFVRLWNVYGSVEAESEKAHVVSDLVRQAVFKKEINLLTDGSELRQFIHIDDVCDGFYSAMTQQPKEVIDVSSFEWVSVFDLASIIAEQTGARVIRGEKKGSSPVTENNGKLEGWNPNVSLVEGIKKMVNELQ